MKAGCEERQGQQRLQPEAGDDPDDGLLDLLLQPVHGLLVRRSNPPCCCDRLARLQHHRQRLRVGQAVIVANHWIVAGVPEAAPVRTPWPRGCHPMGYR